MLCFCFVFLRLMYPMLSVSLDCQFLIIPSVFSNVCMYILVNMKKYRDAHKSFEEALTHAQALGKL